MPVDALTTEKSSVTANPDGSVTETRSPSAVRWKDQANTWHPIDLSLVPGAGGVLAPRSAPPDAARIVGTAAGLPVQVGAGADTFSFGPAVAAPVTPVSAGGTAVFPAALPGGRTISEKVLVDGAEETATVGSAAAGGSWTDTFRVPAGVKAVAATGGISFTDGTGKQLAFYHDGLAVDSAGKAPGAGAQAPVTVSVISQVGQDVSVGVAVDPGWLADPARVFPVAVDPTVVWTGNTTVNGNDTYASSAYRTTPEGVYDPSSLKVGTYNGGGEVDRTYLNFFGTGVDGTGDQITSANLSLYETTSWSCNLGATPALSVQESAAGTNPGNLTWNNQPNGRANPTTSVVAAHGYSGCPAARVNLPVTAQVQDFANGVPDDGFFVFTAENNNYGWKIFSSGEDGANVAPVLSITYQNCSSYNSPATGTHLVCGAIRDKYNALGGPSGVLGYPTTDELATPDGAGRFNHFQNANGYHSSRDNNTGSIYWTPNFGAWSIQGPIRDEWANIGWETSPLGYPTTDQTNLPSMPGAYNHFNTLSGPYLNDGHTGSIYWSQTTGAHAVYGQIRNKWQSLRWEGSYLGLPTSDEFSIPGGRRNNFTGGQINWIGTGPGAGQIEATNGPTTGAGTPSYFAYDTHTLSDNLTAKVNVGTGNLNVTMGLLSVPGVAGPTPLSLNYNSAYQSPQASVHGSTLTGPGWRMGPATDVSLVVYGDGSAAYFAADGNSTTFTANGTTTLTQPPGISSTLTHVAGQHWLLSGHSSGQVLDFGANGGPVQSQADRNGNTITYTYPPGQSGVSTITGTRAGGNPIAFAYGGTCPNNQLCSAAQTADGVTHSFAFAYSGPNNTLATVTEHASGSSQVPIPADRVTRFGYDTANDLTTITDPSGVMTTVGYSSDGQAKVTSFDQDSAGIAATTTFDYTSSFGNTLVHDPDSVAPYNHGMTTYGIDAFGRVISTTDPMGHARATTWTAMSNVASSKDANTQTTMYGYDASGNNLTSAAIPTGATATASYSGPQAYQPDTGTDAQGNVSGYTYDGPGNLTQTKNQATGAVSAAATYNPPSPTCGGKPGEQCSSTDGMGHVITYAYDPSGNLTTSTPPAGGALKASTYTTNGSGKTATVTDGNGQTTTTVYDAFGRTATVTVGASTVTYGYDPNGHTVTRVDPSGTTTYTPDHLGRTTAEQLPNESTALGATYDPAGNTLTYTDATGTVTYAYNADNTVSSVADPGGSCTSNPTSNCITFGYNNNGTRITTTYPGGVTMTVTPDNSGRVKEITARNSSATLNDYSYTYLKGTTDQTLAQSRTDNTTNPATVVNYSYDSLNRLTNATQGTAASWLYCYDGAGNRTGDSTNKGATCPTTPGPGANTYSYDPTNALTAKNGVSTGFAYDNNGNQTAGADTQTITGATYNGFNQLTGLTANGVASTYTYAGTTNAERLTTATAGTTTTTGNGLFGLVNQTTGGATTGYTRDPSGTLIDERTPTGTYYYLFDGTGSVVGLTDSTGSQVATYHYDPYGNTLNTTGTAANPFRYQAGYQDPTGLTKFGARYYDPATGRWTQLDPSGQNPGYHYAGDNPVNNTDPSGECSFFGCVVGAAELTIGYIGIQQSFFEQNFIEYYVASGLFVAGACNLDVGNCGA